MLVTLIAHTNEPEKTIAAAAKLCYSDAHIGTLLDGLTPEKTAAFLQRLSDVGHASPIEHASFTFGIEGVSRTFLAQVTRHRIASFSVQSQRYVRLEDFRYVIPPEIAGIPEAKAQFIDAMNDDARRYLELVHSLEEAHTRRLMAEGHLEEAGYYTIPLKRPVRLQKGQRFALVVKIKSPGKVHPVAIQYDAGDGKRRVVISGEGYLSHNGKRWDRAEEENCDVCLKAYTTER